VPLVFASAVPAELIVTEGPPAFTDIPNTNLAQVNNSDSVLFRHKVEGNFYYLVAGRWFRALAVSGPWTAATTTLPEDFRNIPADGPAGFVRVSVPGTDEAGDAVLVASIPQRATVKRAGTTIQVTYDGEPRFEPIEGTPLTYAVNTPNDVVRTSGAFYCCHQGVWFVAYTAKGPWVVCANVPPEIYTIPPSSPLHNVTYVHIYSSTPETVVIGYTAGYTGQYVSSGVVMFGAGMVAGAAAASDAVYATPYRYTPCVYSYGCGAVYSAAYGGYYRAATAYGPYGGAGRAAVYNPATGAYARGAYAYGPSGSAWATRAYNPNTGVSTTRVGASTPYASWSGGVAARGDNWVAGGQRTGARGSVGWAETSSGRTAIGASNNRGGAAVVGERGGAAVKTASGDVYAGRDGNVYRRQDGQWERDSGNEWSPADRPDSQRSSADRPNRPNAAGASRSPSSSELSNQARARSEGNARATQSRSSAPRPRPAGGRRR
jgi:hypothetical protein